MQALRFARFGPPDVLQLVAIEEPAARVGELKVRVHAAGLNPLDWKIRAGHLRFVPKGRPPRGLGCDFSGVVVAVGGGAHARHVGERVFGSVSPFAHDGAFAEFVVARHDEVTPLPPAIDFATAAALPISGGTAMQVIDDRARVGAGQRVLVTGAAGGVGHMAVQLAKHRGAHVVGVCSAGNAAFVRGLGADEVLDYAREDFTRRDDRFDLVLDAASASTFHAAHRVLTPEGLYVSTAGSSGAVVATVLGGLLGRLTSRQRAVPFVLATGAAQWRRLATLVESGALRPHVERTIELADIPAALGAMAGGHGRGKIVARLA